MRRHNRTASRDGWMVSATTGTGINGAILRVYKRINGKYRDGDHDGRQFATTEEAFAFALERGYTQTFVMEWTPAERKRRAENWKRILAEREQEKA